MGAGPMAHPGGDLGRLPPEAVMTRDDLRAMIVEAITETAERGEIVIAAARRH